MRHGSGPGAWLAPELGAPGLFGIGVCHITGQLRHLFLIMQPVHQDHAEHIGGEFLVAIDGQVEDVDKRMAQLVIERFNHVGLYELLPGGDAGRVCGCRLFGLGAALVQKQPIALAASNGGGRKGEAQDQGGKSKHALSDWHKRPIVKVAAQELAGILTLSGADPCALSQRSALVRAAIVRPVSGRVYSCREPL